MRCHHFLLSAAIAATFLAPAPGSAREESRIRVFMESSAGSRMKGMLSSDSVPGMATLRIHVSHLAPNLEHIVYGDDVEVARFTTDAGGGAELRIDLLGTGSGATPSFDPRGKFVRINDGVSDVLTAWVYADPANDPARPRIKEVTSLEPVTPVERVTSLARVLGVAQGRVDARYDALPSGGARFWVQLRDVTPGDYDILVGGAPVASLTTNASGFGFLDLRVRSGGGNGNGMGMGQGKAHHPRGPLTINPRGALIEVQQGGVTQFSGPMLAQIPGLGVCEASSMMGSLTGASGTGSLSLGVEASCDTLFMVSVAGLAEGTYDLFVDTADVGDILVDATGNGTVVYDEDPDTMEELPLGFAVQSGLAVSIQMGGMDVLTGTVP